MKPAAAIAALTQAEAARILYLSDRYELTIMTDEFITQFKEKKSDARRSSQIKPTAKGLTLTNCVLAVLNPSSLTIVGVKSASP